MKPVKTLTLAFTLIFVLATAAFAGETSCPPGETALPPCVPGETNAPPCAAASSSEDSAALGETSLPALSDFTVCDFAETVRWALSLL